MESYEIMVNSLILNVSSSLISHNTKNDNNHHKSVVTDLRPGLQNIYEIIKILLNYLGWKEVVQI